MKLIKIHIPGGMPRFFDENGNQKPLTADSEVIDAEDFGVEIAEWEMQSAPQFRMVCGNFMTATVVKFPNGKTHIF